MYSIFTDEPTKNSGAAGGVGKESHLCIHMCIHLYLYLSIYLYAYLYIYIYLYQHIISLLMGL